MDIDLTRTFLAIVDGGTFAAASERLFITQGAVSMRVRKLEETLNTRLFERNRAGAIATPAGRRFERHARAMVRAWEQAQAEAAFPEGYSRSLTIGGQVSAWNRFLLRWLPVCQEALPDLAIRAVLGSPVRLNRDLIDGTLDIAILYDPVFAVQLTVEEIIEDQLILVTGGDVDDWRKAYVLVDWGAAIRGQMASAAPALPESGTTLEIGAVASNYLANEKRAGYLPRRIASPYLNAGALREVPDMPVFHYPLYAAYPKLLSEQPHIPTVLKSLRTVAQQSLNNELPNPWWDRG